MHRVARRSCSTYYCWWYSLEPCLYFPGINCLSSSRRNYCSEQFDFFYVYLFTTAPLEWPWNIFVLYCPELCYGFHSQVCSRVLNITTVLDVVVFPCELIAFCIINWCYWKLTIVFFNFIFHFYAGCNYFG